MQMVQTISSAQRITHPPEQRAVVLCVDDEPSVLRALARELSALDADVLCAASAQEAVDILEQTDVAVVISDLLMPGVGGVRFLQRVARHMPDTVRILISGQADFDSMVRAINEAGLFGFLTKPWSTPTLRDTVGRALEQHRMLRVHRWLTSQLSARCAELGIQTISLEKEVQTRTTSMLLGMVNALDLRDTETHWHSRRVALFSRRLAEELGLDQAEVLEVERGALLHDVGKIGVSDTILLKPGKLTAEEWVEMRKHAEYGYQILQNVRFLKNAKQLVWQHHERWLGQGYPRGLAGEDIYIGARIFAVIDTYDAMTSDRPYRKALPHEAAQEEINKYSGEQFDPAVVAAWNRVPRRDWDALRDLSFTDTGGIL